MAYQYKNYEESDAVKKYREQLEQANQQKPGDYASQWQETQKQAYDAVTNRPKFQYSASSDPMYQQYKQQYQRDAKLGMQDTMGQAAAMNGGYGSSYAQMAGQQTYNSQMQQLSDKMPELYRIALDKYQQEGQELLQRYEMASQMEAQDYSRYQDQQAAWRSDRDYAANRYDSERSTDYNLWADSDDREYSRFQDQQQLAQAQVDYLISIGAEVPDSLLEASGYDPGYLAAIKAAREAANSGGGSKSSLKTAISNYTYGSGKDYSGPTTSGNLSADLAALRKDAASVGMTKEEINKKVQQLAGEYYQHTGKYA